MSSLATDAPSEVLSEAEQERRRIVTFADVIKCGSFLAPMAQWKPIAAAVSKPEFDTEILRAETWQLKLFEHHNIKPGDYDALAIVIKWQGLKRKKGESA